MVKIQVVCGVGCVVGFVIPDVSKDGRFIIFRGSDMQDGMLHCMTQKMNV
jgi:hypothetical protein